jgi:hypothetical protein
LGPRLGPNCAAVPNWQKFLVFSRRLASTNRIKTDTPTKKGSISFLKKRNKKLLLFAPSRPFKWANQMLPLRGKSFLVLFFKKELLSSTCLPFYLQEPRARQLGEGDGLGRRGGRVRYHQQIDCRGRALTGNVVLAAEAGRAENLAR